MQVSICLYNPMSQIQQRWGRTVAKLWILQDYSYCYCQGDLPVNQMNYDLNFEVLYSQYVNLYELNNITIVVIYCSYQIFFLVSSHKMYNVD